MLAPATGGPLPPSPSPGRRGGWGRRAAAPAAVPHRGGAGRLVEHVSAVCRSTSLGVTVYSRANAVLDTSVAALVDRNPNLVGFKDGVGNIEMMTRIYAKVGDRLTYIGGLPTAETFALPLLRRREHLLLRHFNFVPEFALGFYTDVRAQDREAVYRRLNDFVIPYLDIRDRMQGYARPSSRRGWPPSAVRPARCAHRCRT